MLHWWVNACMCTCVRLRVGARARACFKIERERTCGQTRNKKYCLKKFMDMICHYKWITTSWHFIQYPEGFLSYFYDTIPKKKKKSHTFWPIEKWMGIHGIGSEESSDRLLTFYRFKTRVEKLMLSTHPRVQWPVI